MPRFLADMHIHSRYSMATSKSLGPRLLAAWGAVKGLQVVATSDFTHPGWLKELEEALEEEGNGLLRLRDPSGLRGEIPWLGEKTELTPPRFILGTEISSIYKRGGVLRKVHNLVFFPCLDSVHHFNKRLERIGNLKSDGRPILGLDAHDLLEIVLETDDRGFVIPAHIWTPWFSLFGSQSGFNSLSDCFGSLSGEIFALETGLSSDPEMNWLWSALDNYRLVSNSDAHSGEKLAREANLFQGEMSYDNILQALKNPEQNPNFLGTVEFFPQEGKYHLDGHRACGVRLDPRETLRLNNICPVCGKPVTVGVLNRIYRLADRVEPQKPQGSPSYYSLIPLPEILSEILGAGSKTKKVRRFYHSLLQSHNSELQVLLQAPIAELKSLSPALAEAVRRMRSGEVHREPGFDGQFGIISAFTPQEQSELRHGKRLVPYSGPGSHSGDPGGSESVSAPVNESRAEEEKEVPVSFNAEQKRAVEATGGPFLVVAGPGTGKTRTLAGRTAHLLRSGCRPRDILALTFTRAAARELRQRLDIPESGENEGPRVGTLHSLAYEDLTHEGNKPHLLPEEEARKLFLRSNPDLSTGEGKRLWERLTLARETLCPEEELREPASNYGKEKQRLGLWDYTDLLERWLELDTAGRYSQVLLDEVQDLSPLQIRMVSRLCLPSGEGLFAIGDPGQSIYGFRGATEDVESELATYWPHLQRITLGQNYRSAQNILDFAGCLSTRPVQLTSQILDTGGIHFYQAQSEKQEAVWIAERVRGLLGGTGHLQVDQQNAGGLGPGDIAVLVRIKALLPQLHRTLHHYGIPCSVPEQGNFWDDPRVRSLLDAVGSRLGLAEPGTDTPQCPDEALRKGPAALADAFRNSPDFDPLFWDSRPFRDLLRAWRERGGWSELLDWIALERELAQMETRSQRVALCTLHAAKGMEFEAVFLPALEEGILPLIHEANGGEPENGEEERRLLYVGLTRAKSRLHLSRASRRQLYGTTTSRHPSRFLNHLPWESVSMSRGIKRKVAQEKRLRLI
ncbi:MAG: UvrD-helicase domain-containing protein [Desulfohalobiaceae bacterium]|nr:UvrD-helicase domain-containing protein [Desulfohalobiaceae bacterium]